MSCSKSFSFVDKLSKARFSSSPFPHWTISNFFPQEQYDSLTSSLPTSRDIFSTSNSNCVYQQNTSYRLELPSNNSSYSELDVLYDQWNNERLDILKFLSTFYFDISINITEEILDLSFSRADFRSSSPVVSSNTTQLGPHCDNPKELLAGLIYLRDSADTSQGGDLDLYTLKPNSPSRYMSNNRRIPCDFIQTFKSIPYESNSAIFFLPTEKSIHGVSPRNPTPFERRLINLSIELPLNSSTSLWNVSEFSFHQHPSLLRRLWSRFKYPQRNFSNYNYMSTDKL